MTMQNRIVGIALGAMLFALCASAEAQQAKKVFRIGLLVAVNQVSVSSRIDAFRQGLRQLGYIEGKNIIIESRYADGKLDRLPELAAELVGLNVDLIVCGGLPPTRAAQRATKTIPIVMTNVGNPAGLVDRLAKPGGNTTGLTQMAAELGGKRLELLKESFAKISRVAVFIDVDTRAQSIADTWEQLQKPAEALGVKVHAIEIRGPNPDLDGAFRAAASEHVNALLIPPSPALNLDRKRVIELAARGRLPAIYAAREFVDIGGLMSYGPEYDDLFRRAAVYVDKILKGTKPADLPVEQPTKFEFIINLKAAKQIGLTIPPNVLVRADRVIR
jgi:putative tryptophan/tyrosine transport system substrate-binding protein